MQNCLLNSMIENKEDEEQLELYPDIKYHIRNSTINDIEIDNLEHLVYKVHATTGLGLQKCEAIVKSFFKNMRNVLLDGDSIVIEGFGQMILSSPKTTNNEKRIFVKFKNSKVLYRKLNDKPKKS